MNPVAIDALSLPDTQCCSDFLAYGFIPGKTYYNSDKTVEYGAGNLPIIISVPHGGYHFSHSPDTGGGKVPTTSLPDRTSGGVTDMDLYTQELGRAVAAHLSRLLPGRYPHLIVCRVHREKLDANRDRQQCCDNEQGRRTWDDYQRCCIRAKHSIVHRQTDTMTETQSWERGRHGLFIDLHGQKHDTRCQLGYLLNKHHLQTHSHTESTEQQHVLSSKCSLFGFAPHSSSVLEVLGGSQSFGAAVERCGYPCVPSPSSPCPEPDCLYFNGGHNTVRHGSSSYCRDKKKTELDALLHHQDPQSTTTAAWLSADLSVGLAVSAIQIETASDLRSTEEKRQAFGAAVAQSIVQLFVWHRR